jgi:hypothetical protein
MMPSLAVATLHAATFESGDPAVVRAWPTLPWSVDEDGDSWKE